MAGKGGGASYPFPNQPVQPQVQPPQAGMKGKGVGQPQVDPNVLTSLQSVLQGQATQPQQAGLAGKGLGQAPQTQPGMGGKGLGNLSQDQLNTVNNGGTARLSQPAPGMGGKGGRITPDSTFTGYESAEAQAAGDAAKKAAMFGTMQQPQIAPAVPVAPQVPAPRPMVTPTKPIAPVSNPKNMLPAPVVNKKNQQQIAAEAKQQQMQRQIQQLAAKVKGRR
jgi:hypothetical protein